MRVFVVLAVIAGVALPAGAADRAPAGKDGATAQGAPGQAQGQGATSAEARELAGALISKQEWEQVLDHYASGLSGQVSQSLTARGEKVPQGLEGKLRDELGKELPYDQVLQRQAQALAGKFSPDELKRAAGFYSSPLGKRIVQALPEAQSELGHELQGRLATAVPQIVQRVAPKALASEGPAGAAPGRASPSAPRPGAREPQGTGSTSPDAGSGASPPSSAKP